MRAIKSILAVLAALVMVAAVVGVCAFQLLADRVRPAEDPTAVTAPMAKDAYNGYGLEDGLTLSTEKLAEIDGKVCYEDRVFRRFSYEQEDVASLAKAMKALKSSHPELDYYVMPVPGRVLAEEGYDQDREAYGQFIADMESELGEAAALLDPWPALREHSDEYVFYRTEDGWTARGAYYGSVMLCEALGIEPFPLEDYEEQMYADNAGIRGSLALDTKRAYEAIYGEDNETVEKLHVMAGDLLYFYNLPGAANLEEIYDKETGKMTRQPVLSQTRVGTAGFVGTGFLHARVFGDSRSDAVKDETLLVLCDGTGSILVPYMAGYYKDVYVVSLQNDEGFLDRLDVLLDRFDIHSVALVQQVEKMGTKRYNESIRDLWS